MKDITNIGGNKTILQHIFMIRRQQVILDSDLAYLYNVETRTLKQAVKRNLRRFPTDFMFQLTRDEWRKLITNCDKLPNKKYSPALPFAFTEQGVAMLSSILNSDKAISVNIQILRAFTRMRKLLLEHKDLRWKIENMEKKYDKQFRAVFDAIKRLLSPPPRKPVKPKLPIGFHVIPK